MLNIGIHQAPSSSARSSQTGRWDLALCRFLRLGGDILRFCGGVILIVARQSFRNLLRGELAVILGMQNFGDRAGIRVHCLNISFIFVLIAWTEGRLDDSSAGALYAGTAVNQYPARL
jgi:hypothetical protein